MPLTSPCIVGHELTHGLIQASCDLEYYSESGALNESYCDIFGAMFELYLLEHKNKLFPEFANEIFFDNHPMRSFKDPKSQGQPDSISSMYKGTDDNAGVHINSGIINHLFYRLTLLNGGTQTDRKNIFKLFISVLNKLKHNSTFIDFKRLLLYEATDELIHIINAIL